MKKLAKHIVASVLALLARGVIRKYRPAIVMVTGSVGKTSTKDAVSAALSAHFLVRASEKSYNSEFGVPLTVIGAKNPWTNPFGWIRVFQEALALIMLPSHYPKLLVLEVGADNPGDLARILRIATPDVVIVTQLPAVPVHVEAYATPAAVREEEFEPAYSLAPGAPLIISSDDPFAADMARPLPVHLMTYGFSKDADIALGEPSFSIEKGMTAAVSVAGETFEVAAPRALGRQQLYAPAAALAAALALGVPLKEAKKGLAAYDPPPGRARILLGRNGSTLVDDSYNSSPAAVEEALSAIALVPGTRRIAALGDMLELGRYSAREHERIGMLAASACDMVVSVGPRARSIVEAARRADMAESHALIYENSREAAIALSELVREGDVVLVKGSQSMRMERIVEALLRDPADRSLLVRQDREWKSR